MKTPSVFGDAALIVPSVIGSKVAVQGYTCASMLVYTITCSFLDGLISKLVWRCIMGQSRRLLFLLLLPPLFRLL